MNQAATPIDTTTVGSHLDVAFPWAYQSSIWKHPWERDWVSSNRDKVVGFDVPVVDAPE